MIIIRSEDQKVIQSVETDVRALQVSLRFSKMTKKTSYLSQFKIVCSIFCNYNKKKLNTNS